MSEIQLNGLDNVAMSLGRSRSWELISFALLPPPW